MARLCERPGCSTPADVAYGFDAELLTVWLDAFHTAQGARSGVLCRRHADAMVVPLGWMLDDRREPVPRLFKPAETPVARGRTRRPRTSTRDDTEQLQLVAVEDVDDDEADDEDGESDALVDYHVEPTSDEAAAAVAPWQPVFDQTDDLQGLLNARGPLLSRAFNGAPIDER
jgi:hypothetical protein